jgi:hypothetical protein
MRYDCYVTMEMQQAHCYTTWTITLLWKCNILSVTQHELLRYCGNAIWCIAHVTKANLICHSKDIEGGGRVLFNTIGHNFSQSNWKKRRDLGPVSTANSSLQNMNQDVSCRTVILCSVFIYKKHLTGHDTAFTWPVYAVFQYKRLYIYFLHACYVSA